MNEKKEKLLNELRAIVGNKRFMFPTEYLTKSSPKIGSGGRTIHGVSKKYVFVNCWAVSSVDEQGERGIDIKKYPLGYHNRGMITDKVALDDLFTKDIEHLLKEIKFFIWLQVEVELPKLEMKLKELRGYKKIYDNIAPLGPFGDEYKI